MMRRDAVNKLDELLARKRALDARPVAAPAFAVRLQQLRAWQAARLAQTYADLREDRRYGAAVEFFLRDVYGADNIARRDSDFERAWRHFKRALPRTALDVLERGVALDLLSAELDHAMAERLPAVPLSGAIYAATYRRVGRVDERRRQIDLLIGIGADLDRIVHRAWIAVALRSVHAPAHAAGFGVLQDFLERGLDAFRQMRGADEFLGVIRARETQLLEAIMSGDRPFEAALQPAAAR